MFKLTNFKFICVLLIYKVFIMKTAICFSGAIRNFDECISSTIKYLIANFDNPDIFLHLWTFNDNSLSDINYNFKWRKDNSSTDNIISILKPKKYVIEEYNNTSEELIKKLCMVDTNLFDTDEKKNYGFNCCSMYWKILKSFELAEEYMGENNFTYDLVIRARLDFIWEDHIKQSDFNNLHNDNIYLIKDRYATCSKLITNDKFFAGNYLTMKQMCNIFNCLKKYQDGGINIEGQTINEHHIKQSKFNVEWLGHTNTYYKFMDRHKVINKKIKISVNLGKKFFNSTINELIYTFLHNGYNISSANFISEYNLLNKFFIPNNKSNVYDYIIRSYNKTIIIVSAKQKKITLKFASNEILSVVNDNPHYLNDFLLSIIINFSQARTEYVFTNIKQINDIKQKEIVKYKNSDKGYYTCEYVEIKNNSHIILFNKNNIKVNRDTFKIVKILNYYEENFLPIN